MSLALSNTKSEKDISFNKKSLVSLDNKQVSSGKSYTLGEVKVGFKCNYLKMVVNISTSNTELTTDDYKTVTAVYKIKYIDDEEDNTTKEITECFSPKYQHEVKNKNTYVIIEVPAKKIVNINITVYNNETKETITINKLRLFYSRLMDEEETKKAAKEEVDNSSFIIPILDSLPDPSSVQNGYVFILRSLL